jgi:hypothetical protein
LFKRFGEASASKREWRGHASLPRCFDDTAHRRGSRARASRARTFYERLGWRLSTTASSSDYACFALNNIALTLEARPLRGAADTPVPEGISAAEQEVLDRTAARRAQHNAVKGR